MNILIAIPHYFDPEVRGPYGALRPDKGYCAKGLATLILSLHENFGRTQVLINQDPRHPVVVTPANASTQNNVQIVIVATQNKHVLDQLGDIATLFVNVTPADPSFDPRLLGMQCRRVLLDAYRRSAAPERSRASQGPAAPGCSSPSAFDFYGFMEHDMVIRDPLFFDKLSLFNARFGNECVLMPNRYEVESSGELSDERRNGVGIKLYCDGDVEDKDFSKGYPFLPPQGPGGAQPQPRMSDTLTLDALGRPVKFHRPRNPHSACWFLNRAQFGALVETPYYMELSAEFVGHFESVATLPLLKRFYLYKPHPDNANFLEVQHFRPWMLPQIGVKK